MWSRRHNKASHKKHMHVFAVTLQEPADCIMTYDTAEYTETKSQKAN